jgi:hypothetical protein
VEFHQVVIIGIVNDVVAESDLFGPGVGAGLAGGFDDMLACGRVRVPDFEAFEE